MLSIFTNGLKHLRWQIRYETSENLRGVWMKQLMVLTAKNLIFTLKMGASCRHRSP